MSATTKTFHYVCSHDLRAENPLHIRLTEMFDAVRRETAGRLEVEIVPWGGTGPSKVTLTKLLVSALAEGIRGEGLDAARRKARARFALTARHWIPVRAQAGRARNDDLRK